MRTRIHFLSPFARSVASQPYPRPSHVFFRLLFLACLVSPSLSRALPSFARQTGFSCVICHTEFPELTSFGRQFKLGGYTLSAEQTRLPPIAVMLLPSFTHTQKDQAGGAAPGFSANNNTALTQASIFYGGRLLGPYAKDLFDPSIANVLNKIGVFFQTTYDGAAKTWAWDNTEIRYADHGTLGGHAVSFGLYADNNPTLQDPWNSSPAWTFPFSGSGLAPTPAAATLIDGGLAQQVAGAGAYAFFDNTFYVDVAGYHTFGSRLQKSFGITPDDEAQVSGVAPYWRLAMEHPVGNGTWQFGVFGLAAATYPGRDASAGKDRIVDFGLDSEYQVSLGKNDLTFTTSWIDEHQHWDASEALGLADNTRDTLRSFKLTAHELYDKTYGAFVQYFALNGDADPTLYGDSATGSPNSNGFVFQFDYLPLNKGGGPDFWPRSNVKFTVQYVLYNRFNGARSNFDGAGANAHDNNTLYFEAWVAF